MSKSFVPLLRCSKQSQYFLQSYHKKSIHLTSFHYVKDYYTILGVPRSANAKDIKSAYYDKAKSYHPDASRETEASAANAAKFQEISEAYEILGDEQKRRLYDSTTRRTVEHDVYGRTRKKDRRDVPYRPREGPREPINMNHLSQVYKALNRPENEETPVYAPFADHCHPGTHYNRFEYSRMWDMEQRRWVYVKKATAGEYARQMNAKGKILRTFIAVVMFGTLGFSVFNNFIQASPLKINTTKADKIEMKRVHAAAHEEKERLALQTIKFDD